jgi:hypothetical protein
VEGAGPRARVVVARGRGRPRVADDLGEGEGRIAARDRLRRRHRTRSSKRRSLPPALDDLSNPKNSHASPTPIVDGDRIYVHFGAEGTAALTITGEIVWKAKFPYESQHGNGGSPCSTTIS